MQYIKTRETKTIYRSNKREKEKHFKQECRIVEQYQNTPTVNLILCLCAVEDAHSPALRNYVCACILKSVGPFLATRSTVRFPGSFYVLVHCPSYSLRFDLSLSFFRPVAPPTYMLLANTLRVFVVVPRF